MDSKTTWKRGRFEIHVGICGTIEVSGWVGEYFGLRRNNRRWEITHLPTGYRIRKCVRLKTLADAKEYCRRIAPTLNWPRLTPKSAERRANTIIPNLDRIAKRMGLRISP